MFVFLSLQIPPLEQPNSQESADDDIPDAKSTEQQEGACRTLRPHETCGIPKSCRMVRRDHFAGIKRRYARNSAQKDKPGHHHD